MENVNANECSNLMDKIKNEISSLPNYNFTINVSFGSATTTDQNIDIYKIHNQALKNMHDNKIYDGSSISKKTVDVIMTTLFDKSFRRRCLWFSRIFSSHYWLFCSAYKFWV